jgi:hypothetical protein
MCINSQAWINADYHYVVTDFTAGEGGDLIDVRNVIRNYAYSYYPNNFTGGNPFSGSNPLFQIVQSGADTLIQIDRDGIGAPSTWATYLTLQHVSPSSLTAANFVGVLTQVAHLWLGSIW